MFVRFIVVGLIAFFLGATAGALVMNYLHPFAITEAAVERADKAEEKADTENHRAEALQKQVDAMAQNEQNLKGELAALKAQPAPAAPAAPAPGSPMDDLMRKAMETHLNNRIDSLALALGLRPDQVARLREATKRAMTSGTGPARPGPLGRYNAAEFNKELDSMLTDEQKAKYAEFQKKEWQANIETMANVEVSQLQSTLGLTQEQADKAFQKLTEAGQTMYNDVSHEGNGQPPVTEKVLEEMINKKVEAMKDILTPQQLELYRKQQQSQIEMAKQFLKQQGGNGAPVPLPPSGP
jgi:hypothetical protein